MAIPKSVCDNCVNTECLWRAPTGGNDPPVMICHNKIDKPRTNYDRIISKTPEELAEWINNEYGSTDWCPVDAPVDPVTRKCLVHDDCAECIVDWLKQEAE